MRRIALIAAAVILLCAGYLLIHRSRPVTSGPAALPRLPDLSLVDLNSRPLKTSAFKGKVLLVNFWAAWCGPCTAEVPEFLAMRKKYQAQGFEIVGVSIDDDEHELRSFVAKSGIDYPIVIGNEKITDAFGGVLGLPTTYIIGRDGKVHGKQVGVTDFAALERQIIPLLRQRSN